MAEDFAVDEGWEGAQFEPGWPDIQPLGLIVARTAASPRGDGPADELPDEDVVDWTIHLGVASTIPRLALIGDLTVHNPTAFAGVTVVMPFCVRDLDESVLSQDQRRGLVKQYGPWASSFMYDHAAMAARSMLAGNGLTLSVPYSTPEVDLHFDEDEDEQAASDQDD